MQYLCPNCGLKMESVVFDTGMFYFCSSCKGILLSIVAMKKHIEEKAFRTIWSSIPYASPDEINCPSCKNSMLEITESELAPFSLCKNCQLVFFDEEEKAKLAAPFQLTRTKSNLEKLTQQERVDYAKALSETTQAVHTPKGEVKPTLRQLLCGAAGLVTPQKGFPDLRKVIVTPLILVGMTLVTILGYFYLSDEQWETYIGFERWDFFAHYGSNFVLSFFAHSNGWHLIVNAHYLRTFGPQVEEKLGIKQFLLLILICEIVGNLLFSFSDTSLATVGASGAIMGILTFYALTFPHEKVGIGFFYYRTSPTFRSKWWLWLPSWSVLILLVLQNIISASIQLGTKEPTKTNYLSHVGGILVGFVFWVWNGSKFKTLKKKTA